MSPNSKVSGSIATAPPSYDIAISASPIHIQSSTIPLLRGMKRTCTTVLSRIRDIVLAPDIPPSSVLSTMNACAAALPAAKFSNILQSCNIEGHTTLYWAIMNNRPEALSALSKFISCKHASSVYLCNARLACMAIGDHALFMQLGLADDDIENVHLRHSLGCPPDKLHVHACDEPNNRFDIVLCIRMFLKRLHTTQYMAYEFIAGGRIWWLRFCFAENTSRQWYTELGLSPQSYPARPNAVLLIEAHKQKAGFTTSLEALNIPLKSTGSTLGPWRSVKGAGYWHLPGTSCCITSDLGDWVTNEKTKYVDHEGTLHAKLELSL